MADHDLEKRIQRLEDIEEIKAIKRHYLACCDAKDPDGVRSCFVDGPAKLEYGPVGNFDTADAMVEIYTQIACHDHMVETHQGLQPRIDITGADTAEGRWTIQYQLIDTRAMRLTQIGGHYTDTYRKTADGWKISASRMETTSALAIDLGEDALKLLLATNQPPNLAG